MGEVAGLTPAEVLDLREGEMVIRLSDGLICNVLARSRYHAALTYVEYPDKGTFPIWTSTCHEWAPYGDVTLARLRPEPREFKAGQVFYDPNYGYYTLAGPNGDGTWEMLDSEGISQFSRVKEETLRENLASGRDTYIPGPALAIGQTWRPKLEPDHRLTLKGVERDGGSFLWSTYNGNRWVGSFREEFIRSEMEFVPEPAAPATRVPLTPADLPSLKEGDRLFYSQTNSVWVVTKRISPDDLRIEGSLVASRITASTCGLYSRVEEVREDSDGMHSDLFKAFGAADEAQYPAAVFYFYADNIGTRGIRVSAEDDVLDIEFSVQKDGIGDSIWLPWHSCPSHVARAVAQKALRELARRDAPGAQPEVR